MKASDTITTLLRGPYLQEGTPSSIIIRWRTAKHTSSYVKLGLSTTALTTLFIDTNRVIDHIVPVAGLTPNTKYFYSIGVVLHRFVDFKVNYLV